MSEDMRVCSNLGCKGRAPVTQMQRKQTSAKPFYRLVCPACVERTRQAAMRAKTPQTA
jgi:hypothetical protein